MSRARPRATRGPYSPPSCGARRAEPCSLRGDGGGHRHHVGHRDRAARAGRRNLRKIDAELARPRPYRGRGMDIARLLRLFGAAMTAASSGRAVAAFGRSRSPTTVPVSGCGPSSKSSKGAPTSTRSPGRTRSRADAPGLRRRNFHDGLLGLDGEQRLIGDDVLSFGHVPSNDFGRLQSLSKIRELERCHE